MNSLPHMISEPAIALVDEQDTILGYAEKLHVHRHGLLHRAFSIFVLNPQRELLLQRRAFDKYHSPGLWTNTCCSHAVEGEAFHDTLQRRLQEEMGFSCALQWQFSFRYQVAFANGLIENELDHVYLGHYAGAPRPNSREVAECKWAALPAIRQDLHEHGDAYTHWFRLVFERVYDLVMNNCEKW